MGEISSIFSLPMSPEPFNYGNSRWPIEGESEHGRNSRLVCCSNEGLNAAGGDDVTSANTLTYYRFIIMIQVNIRRNRKKVPPWKWPCNFITRET